MSARRTEIAKLLGNTPVDWGRVEELGGDLMDIAFAAQARGDTKLFWSAAWAAARQVPPHPKSGSAILAGIYGIQGQGK